MDELQKFIEFWAEYDLRTRFDKCPEVVDGMKRVAEKSGPGALTDDQCFELFKTNIAMLSKAITILSPTMFRGKN